MVERPILSRPPALQRDNVDDHAPDTLPEPSPDVVWRRLNDEVVLVHLPTNRIFTLNETGARLWELLSEEGSRAELEACLRSEYGVADDDVGETVKSLLSQLARELLVHPRASYRSLRERPASALEHLLDAIDHLAHLFEPAGQP